MQETLHEYHAAEPAVEEVEMLIRNACEEGEDTFSLGEKNCEGC
jgi:hypothetical protein